jgi:hypothetical protein
MEDKETYTNLTKTLDSLRDMVLAEIRLIKTEEEKVEFAEFMTEKVNGWRKDLASDRRAFWKQINASMAGKLRSHATELLSANPPLSCPPGFVEVEGVCVPI